MEHVNGWCFRGIYKGGLWENDLHVSALHGMSIYQITVRYDYSYAFKTLSVWRNKMFFQNGLQLFRYSGRQVLMNGPGYF